MKHFEDTICEIADQKGWAYEVAERWFEQILTVVGRSQGWTLKQMVAKIDRMTATEFHEFIDQVMACL